MLDKDIILKIRRQIMLDPGNSVGKEQGYLLGIKLAKDSLSENPRLKVANRERRAIARKDFEYLILKYTAGVPVAELTRDITRIINEFDEAIQNEVLPDVDGDYVPYLDLTYIEGYVRILWLMALSVLLGYREGAAIVVSWIDRYEDAGFPNRGRDGLFESIVKAATGHNIESERVLMHPDAFRSLAKATVVDDAEKPAFVAAYLDNWYKAMKGNYWWGFHKDPPGRSSFFGYWSFEAALITYLWDIDDSSYRDHEFYPKDLIDFARGLPSATPAETPSSVEAGQPCPRSGWWFTPAKANSRRHFKKGDVFPTIEGSDFGAIFWQWSPDQSSPKL
jgi:hypothetical protein